MAACLSFVMLAGVGWGFLWYAGLRGDDAAAPGIDATMPADTEDARTPAPTVFASPGVNTGEFPNEPEGAGRFGPPSEKHTPIASK